MKHKFLTLDKRVLRHIEWRATSPHIDGGELLALGHRLLERHLQLLLVTPVLVRRLCRVRLRTLLLLETFNL